jgi:hypothetical protein
MSDDTFTTDHFILEKEPAPLEQHVTDNSAMLDGVMAGAQRRLVTRLFPTPEVQAVREHEMAQVKTGFEYRRRALRMAVETKLQAVEEMCNHVLVTGKSEIRRQRQEFFAEQKLKLQHTMDEHADRFNAEMERRFEALERLRSEVLRRKEEERLLRAVERFHDMLDQLGAEFLQIIHEGVAAD